MPFALVILGLIMIVTGAKGTQSALGSQLVKDFTGSGNFFYWFLAVGSVGALGAIPDFKKFSTAFMSLIIIAMVIKNGGVFDKLTAAIKSGPIAPARPSAGGANSDSGHTGVQSVLDGSYSLQNATTQFGNLLTGAVGSVTQASQQSVANSNAQSGNATKNFGTVTKVLGAIFGF